MKKFLFLGMSALLAAGVLSSCKDDVISTEVPKEEVLTEDKVFYLGVKFMNVNDQTRANDLVTGEGQDGYGGDGYNPNQEPNFHKGTEKENKVNSIYLIFYNSLGERVSATKNIINFLTAGQVSDPSNNAAYQGVIEVEARKGEYPPTQVLALVNPITPDEYAASPEFAYLSDVEKLKRDFVINQESGYFAMSKSSYYGEDPNNRGEKRRLIATPIESDMLCNSKEEAFKTLEGADPVAEGNKKSITIYVERYAAKVDFAFASAALNNQKEIPVYEAGAPVDDETTPQKVILKFTPEYWAVNAYENQTFIVKSFYKEDDNGNISDIQADYDYMNERIGGTNGWTYWNSEAKHRCYWAQSPAYYANRYPKVSDDILDNQAELGPNGGYVLNYYSYDEMKHTAETNKAIHSKARKFEEDGSVKTEEEGGYASKSIYVRENTVSGGALRAAYDDPTASPKAAIGSIVVVGKYTLKDKATNQPINFKENGSQAFYIMGNSDDDYVCFLNDEQMMQFYYNRLFTLLSSTNKGNDRESVFEHTDNGVKIKDDYLPDPGTDKAPLFEIIHPNKEVRNGLVLDSRFVTIQFKNIEKITDGNPMYIRVDNSWMPINEANLTRVNQVLLSAAGITRMFTDGMAYFNIPINHLGFYRSGNPNYAKNLSPTDKEFDWNVVKSGDFGIVRNHYYNIEASEINGLGNAIPDPTTPIVPPTDPDAYYLGAQIVVLNWAIVPKQSVKL